MTNSKNDDLRNPPLQPATGQMFLFEPTMRTAEPDVVFVRSDRARPLPAHLAARRRRGRDHSPSRLRAGGARSVICTAAGWERGQARPAGHAARRRGVTPAHLSSGVAKRRRSGWRRTVIRPMVGLGADVFRIPRIGGDLRPAIEAAICAPGAH